jgi:hypothetical protein
VIALRAGRRLLLSRARTRDPVGGYSPYRPAGPRALMTGPQSGKRGVLIEGEFQKTLPGILGVPGKCFFSSQTIRPVFPQPFLPVTATLCHPGRKRLDGVL